MKNVHETITNLDQIPLIIDVKIFAQLLQVSTPTAYRIIEHEKIPTIKVSRKVQIKKKDLLNWFEIRFGDLAC